MPSATVGYQQPSRGARALVIVLAIAVALFASWVLVSNVVSNLAASRPAAPLDEEPAQTTGALSPVETLTQASVAPLAQAPVAPLTQAPLASEPEPAPPLSEPIVIASTQGLPTPAPRLPPVPAPAPFQSSVSAEQASATEQGSAVMNTFFDKLNIDRNDAVPLPPRRPKVASNATIVPVPRPRPALEDTSERQLEPFLSEADIARMGPQ